MLFEQIKFGQNLFHDEYNKLHFIDKYKSKCINVSFFHNEDEKDKIPIKRKIINQKENSSELLGSNIDEMVKRQKLFKLQNETKQFLAEFIKKSSISKNLISIINSNEREFRHLVPKLIFKCNKLILKYVLCRIDANIKKFIKHSIRNQSEWETVDFDYYNSYFDNDLIVNEFCV